MNTLDYHRYLTLQAGASILSALNSMKYENNEYENKSKKNPKPKATKNHPTLKSNNPPHKNRQNKKTHMPLPNLLLTRKLQPQNKSYHKVTLGIIVDLGFFLRSHSEPATTGIIINIPAQQMQINSCETADLLTYIKLTAFSQSWTSFLKKFTYQQAHI